MGDGSGGSATAGGSHAATLAFTWPPGTHPVRPPAAVTWNQRAVAIAPRDHQAFAAARLRERGILLTGSTAHGERPSNLGERPGSQRWRRRLLRRRGRPFGCCGLGDCRRRNGRRWRSGRRIRQRRGRIWRAGRARSASAWTSRSTTMAIGAGVGVAMGLDPLRARTMPARITVSTKPMPVTMAARMRPAPAFVPLDIETGDGI